MRKIAVALMFVSASCMTPSQPGSTSSVSPSIQVPPGRQFQLGVGQEARIQGTPITVRFQKVDEDSRCPIDVNCVWAGNAVARIWLSAGEGATGESRLNTTLEPKSTSFNGYNIRLVDLKPVPKSGSKIPASSYLAVFEAAR